MKAKCSYNTAMSRFNKTTNIDFQQFGEIFTETTEKNSVCENRTYLNVSTGTSDHLYKAGINTCFRVKEGIAAVAVTSDPNIEPKIYVIHRICRLYPGVYFCFLALSASAVIEVTPFDSDERYPMKPVYAGPEESSIKVKEILGDYYVVRGPNYLFPGETHAFWEITYVDTGELFSKVDGVEYRIKAHQLLFYAPNQSHTQNTTDSTCSYLTVIFDMEISKEDKELLKNRVFDINQKVAELLSTFNRLKKDDKAYMSDLSTSLIQLIVMLILSSAQERSDSNHVNTMMQAKYQDELLGEIALYIQENIYTPITVKDICYRFALSRSSLQALFRNNLGTTPKKYISDLKFFKSKQLIKESSYSISEIARICGFSSIHYFSRDFKKRYGITPTEYARSLGE